MKRRVSVVVVATIAVAVPAALAWPGAPTTPPPKKPMPGAPPPAWIETEAKSGWLFYGTYCWKTACITLIAPETRPGLPVFAVKRGQVIRVHLGFAARSVTVSVGRRKVPAKLAANRRIVSWSASRAGILAVAARASGGSPSYVARLRVR
jgi:hypothetical protein